MRGRENTAMNMKPSKPQLNVLRMIERGEVLQRWDGGFWTTDTKVKNMVPSWWTTVRTIKAMENRGWIIRLNKFMESWRDHRVITKEGLAVLKAHQDREF